MNLAGRTVTLKSTAGTAFQSIDRSQSYALQYTALILIVMTFIVGSFVRPRLPVVSSHPESVANTQPIGHMEFNDIFEPASAVLKTGALDALVTFTRSHDVELNIQVYADSADKANVDPLSIALARSVTITRHLIAAGIQPQFAIVSARAEATASQVTVDVKYYNPESAHETK